MVVGVNVHQAGHAWLARAKAMDVNLVRCDVNWKDVQPTRDTWTWGWLDAFMADAGQLGLGVYPTLSYTPPWLAPNPHDLPPHDAWQDFCGRFAEKYQGVVTCIGCWNEYPGRAVDYVNAILQPMSEVIRQQSATFCICGPDMATVNDTQWPWWLYEVLRRGRLWLDVVTVHVYRDTAAEMFDVLYTPRPRWIPRWIPWPRPSVQQLMSWADAWHLPLALTEFGWRTDEVSEAEQARNYQVFLTTAARTDLLAAVAFQLADETPRPGSWGLYGLDESPKPAVEVFKAFAKQGSV